MVTLCGVAIGLGNVWRFPYMMGKFGGSAFLLVYLVFVLGIAVPALVAEWGLARETGCGTFGALRHTMGRRVGTSAAAVLLLGLLVANAYYTVVIGNIAYTSYWTWTRGFEGQAMADYRQGLTDGWLQFAIACSLISAGCAVLLRGLRRGIEAISRIFVPFFACTMFGLAVLAMVQPGAPEGLREFLRPDFARMGSDEVFAALGQACFSVGLGGTLMLAYGRHLPADARLLPTAVQTASLDTLAALSAAIILVPTVLRHGLDLTQGPGLIFDTLPQFMVAVPGARILGGLFLSALTLMAFLSSLAALVVVRGGISECLDALAPQLEISPRRLLVGLGIAQGALMLPCCLDPALIGVLDIFVGSGLQILGCAISVWAFARLLDPKRARGQSGLSDTGARILLAWLRWPVLAGLIIVFVTYVHSQLSP